MKRKKKLKNGSVLIGTIFFFLVIKHDILLNLICIHVI